ncbi:MAG: universal stress protein [Nitrospira defluvii]|nr:universal stress protein [Nitrospira defluvii]
MNTPLLTRILFATDFSDDAAHAQEYAMYLATAWNATLDVLHVIEAPPWLGVDAETIAVIEQARTDAVRRLEQVRDQMVRSGISVRVRQVLGNPNEHICLVAKDNGADLVVLGVQGRTNLVYGLIGSTAERVVKDGPCQVLAVPGLREEAGKPSMVSRQLPIRHILAPLDFSSASLDAVEYAIHLAKGLDATVTLMHVLEPVCYDLDCGLGMIEEEAGKRDHWTRQLTELTQLATALGLEVDFEISGGMPSDAILACALRHQSDLIVMGTHGRRSLSDGRFGSVAEAVLRRTTCPILSVKTPKFAADHRRVMPLVMGKTEAKSAGQ